MNILCIETSTNICSVAISQNGKCIATLESHEGNHVEKLPVFINQLLEENNITLHAVAISQGPGSYTGLRIGTATAKGICYGQNIPLIAIDTLKIIAAGAVNKISLPENAILCPMIDARRMEVYCQLYNTSLKPLDQTEAIIVEENCFSNILDEHQVFFCGNGAEKCKQVLQSSNACFIDDIFPLAKNMCQPAEEAYTQNEIADIAYFDPFYLKEYQAVKSKNKIINI